MSDPKEPFEAAVRAGCNALYPIAKCPFPEGEACQRHCAEEVAFAKAVLTAALPPAPAPETIEAMARKLFHSSTHDVWDRRWQSLHEDGLRFVSWCGSEIPHESKNFFRGQAADAYRALRASLLQGEEPS